MRLCLHVVTLEYLSVGFFLAHPIERAGGALLDMSGLLFRTRPPNLVCVVTVKAQCRAYGLHRAHAQGVRPRVGLS